MSIRIRTVDGVRVALCAVEADEQPGDIYLDDGDHGALVAKFEHDRKLMGFDYTAYPREWAAMESQKVRDAREEMEKRHDAREEEQWQNLLR